MRLNGTRGVMRAVMLALASHGLAMPLAAQGPGATLSGTIADSAGAPVPHATIMVRNATGQATTTDADSVGHYTLVRLAPGQYTVSVAAAGFRATVVAVALTTDAPQTLNVTLPQGGLSLADLGFSTAETQGSAQEQARLDRRSHMLQVHQRLGLLAAVPLLATVITGTFAGGRSPSTPDRTAHAVLGTVTAGLYVASASYALRAPKIPGTPTRGPIRLHKWLAWIHGPGMILTLRSGRSPSRNAAAANRCMASRVRMARWPW